jgi:hypothetical protein
MLHRCGGYVGYHVHTKHSFTVHLPDRDIVFCRHRKLYIADFAQQIVVHATRAYTKAEVERATSYIIHMPALTAKVVRRAQELFGYQPRCMRGKITKK